MCFGITNTNKQVNTNFCNFLCKFLCFQLQEPENLLLGLVIGHCVVSSNNGLVFNILMSRILAFFG